MGCDRKRYATLDDVSSCGRVCGHASSLGSIVAPCGDHERTTGDGEDLVQAGLLHSVELTDAFDRYMKMPMPLCRNNLSADSIAVVTAVTSPAAEAITSIIPFAWPRRSMTAFLSGCGVLACMAVVI